MTSLLYKALAPLCLLLVCSCATINDEHQVFCDREDYCKTHDVYTNIVALEASSPASNVLQVDLSDQRAKLIDEEGVVLLNTPVTTGKAGKRTPKGSYPITSKIRHKKSSIFGRLYRGNRIVYGGDKRKYRGSYTRFVGSSLPYWMRLTDDGIGLHGSGGIKRYPASNGCIRVPHDTASTLYSKLTVGSVVTVVE